MCVLPDSVLRVRGPMIFNPFDDASVQPTSYEIHLGDSIGLPSPGTHWPLDIRRLAPGRYTRTLLRKDGYVLRPFGRILGSTKERITVPSDLTMRVEGVSTIGRCFVLIHATAGHAEPGFDGEITCEIINLMDDQSFLIYPNMRIGQVVFETLAGVVEKPYGHPDLGNHYQGQQGPTSPASRKE